MAQACSAYHTLLPDPLCLPHTHKCFPQHVLPPPPPIPCAPCHHLSCIGQCWDGMWSYWASPNPTSLRVVTDVQNICYTVSQHRDGCTSSRQIQDCTINGRTLTMCKHTALSFSMEERCTLFAPSAKGRKQSYCKHVSCPPHMSFHSPFDFVL